MLASGLHLTISAPATASSQLWPKFRAFPVNLASGRAKAKRVKLKRAPAKERRWSRPQPLGLRWAAQRESPRTTAKRRLWALRQEGLPVFWLHQESVRRSICRKGRNSNLFLTAPCTWLGKSVSAIGNEGSLSAKFADRSWQLTQSPSLTSKVPAIKAYILDHPSAAHLSLAGAGRYW